MLGCVGLTESGRVVGHLALEGPVRAAVARRRQRGLLREGHLRTLHVLVRNGLQQMVDHVDTSLALVRRLHDVPARGVDVRVDEHLVLGTRVVLPAGQGLQVGGRELPAPHRISHARLEALVLLLLRNGEPVLAQQDPVVDEHPLEDRALLEEAPVLLRGAIAHDVLDAAAVVPGAVEQADLAGGGQVRDVALEVPLGALTLGGDGKRDDARDTRVEVLGDAFDRPALACRVTALEDDDDAGSGGPDPLLHLDQLRLQPQQLGLVQGTVHGGVLLCHA